MEVWWMCDDCMCVEVKVCKCVMKKCVKAVDKNVWWWYCDNLCEKWKGCGKLMNEEKMVSENVQNENMDIW